MKCKIVVEAVYGVFEDGVMRGRKMAAGAVLEGPDWYIESLIRDGYAQPLATTPAEPETVQNPPENAQNAPLGAAVDASHPFFDAGLRFAAVMALVEAGFHTWSDIEQAADDDLLAVDGVGPATLRRLRAWAGSQE